MPPPPNVEPELSSGVNRALLRQSAHLSKVVTALSPPTALSWVVLLWSQADQRGLLIWCTLVIVIGSRTGYVAHKLDTMSYPGPADVARFARSLFAGGLSWGAIAVLGMPREVTWHAVVGILVISPMAVNAIFSASVARFFWSFQLGLVAVASVGLVRAGSGPSLTVLVVVVYALPFSALLARINRTTYTTAALYAARSQRNAAELRVANDHLVHEASHDALTGLANRPAFMRRVDQAMERRAIEGSSGHVGLLFMDLDRFKQVNDTLGHAAGDQVLRAAAARIAGRLRDEDLLSRLGGDEFTILVDGVTDIDDLERVATRVLSAFDQPFAVGGREYDVGGSIGFACSDAGLTNSTELLRAADTALYEAKAAGRGVVRAYDSGLRARLDRRRTDEDEVRHALRSGQMVAWFQPIVEMGSGRMVGAEALARWDTGNGVRSAGSFIDVVVGSGLEADLSLAVAKTVRRVRQELSEHGAAIGLGLNVPPSCLNQVLDELRLEGDLRGLTLEITENGIIADLEGARRRLAQLRSQGAAVWLDDFGQGQSSLSLVLELPLDGVKIDRSFVSDMLASREARTIVIAIAEIGRCLGLDVIAEGVETPEQVAALSALGVTHAQGFLVSPAVDAEAFVTMAKSGAEWPDALEASRLY